MAARTERTSISVLASVLPVAIALAGASCSLRQAAQLAGNEAATQQNLKTIAAMEIQYYNTHLRTFGTFDQLIKEQMLTSKFSGDSPTIDGYVLKLKINSGTSSQPGSYTLNADPQSDTTGRNHFYLDSTSATIHVNPDRSASPNDPPFK